MDQPTFQTVNKDLFLLYLLKYMNYFFYLDFVKLHRIWMLVEGKGNSFNEQKLFLKNSLK